MDKRRRAILVENVRRLMTHKGIKSEVALAAAAGLDQKTINNLLNPERFPGSPLMETVEKVAEGLDVPVWYLFIENVPMDILTSRSIDKVVDCFVNVGPEGRRAILRVSENEVRYNASIPKASNDE